MVIISIVTMLTVVEKFYSFGVQGAYGIFFWSQPKLDELKMIPPYGLCFE